MIKPDEQDFILSILVNKGRLLKDAFDPNTTDLFHDDDDLTKREYAILKKWAKRGHWDFGVSIRTGWMTESGIRFFIQQSERYVAPEEPKSVKLSLE